MDCLRYISQLSTQSVSPGICALSIVSFGDSDRFSTSLVRKSLPCGENKLSAPSSALACVDIGSEDRRSACSVAAALPAAAAGSIQSAARSAATWSAVLVVPASRLSKAADANRPMGDQPIACPVRSRASVILAVAACPNGLMAALLLRNPTPSNPPSFSSLNLAYSCGPPMAVIAFCNACGSSDALTTSSSDTMDRDNLGPSSGRACRLACVSGTPAASIDFLVNRPVMVLAASSNPILLWATSGARLSSLASRAAFAALPPAVSGPLIQASGSVAISAPNPANVDR